MTPGCSRTPAFFLAVSRPLQRYFQALRRKARTPPRSSPSLPWKKCSAPAITINSGSGAKSAGPRTHGVDVDEFVLVALHDQPGTVRTRHGFGDDAADRRRNRHELHRLRAVCRRLQSGRRTEREPAEPQRVAVEVPACPVDHGERIREFANAPVVLTFAGTHATEIETHRRRPRLLHGPGSGVHDLVLHRAAKQRMRVADDADDPAGRPGWQRIFDARLDGAGRTSNLDGQRHGRAKRFRNIGRTCRQWRRPGAKEGAAVCQNAAGPPPGHGRIGRRQAKE